MNAAREKYEWTATGSDRYDSNFSVLNVSLIYEYQVAADRESQPECKGYCRRENNPDFNAIEFDGIRKQAGQPLCDFA